MWFVKVFRGGGGMECVRRAVAVEVESPPPELYAVEEPYRRIVEEVAAYVAERDAGEGEVQRAVPPLQKAVPLARPADSAGHKPRRRDGEIFPATKERRPSPQAPPRGGAGFDKIRQRQLEL